MIFKQFLGIPWWSSWYCQCYGMGLIPGLGTSTCRGGMWKLKKRKRERNLISLILNVT